MHKYLKDLLICPHCKHDLQWNIFECDDIHIIEASANCSVCDRTFFVKDRVGCFLLELC